MRKRNLYITVKFKWLDEFQSVKIMINGAWFYVCDLASIILFENLQRYFTIYEDVNDIPLIPDKIMFCTSRKKLLVTAYLGKNILDSCDWEEILKSLLKFKPAGLDSDLIRFLKLFTPLGRGSAA